MPAKGVFLDTNVLLTATAPARRLHTQAQSVLTDWPGQGKQLFVSGQVLREYLAVATRPMQENGLGLTLAQALENVESILLRLRLLEEPGAVFSTLKSLLSEVPCTGKQIHDANIVATALAHRVPAILTQNLQHFARFSPRIELLDLARVSP